MKFARIAVIVACWPFAVGSAQSQENAPVLQGKQVTERALIDALKIESPLAPDGATRSFGIVKPNVTVRSDAGRGNSGKANLVMTFGTNSAELTSDTTRTLDTVAKALQSDQLAGFAFRIEGHADPRGAGELNRQLSERRAAAVVKYLVEHHGILAERLTAAGKGSDELLDNKNPTAAVNRRVTIITLRG